MHSTRFRALGTTAQVVVSDGAVLDDARALLADELSAIDHACSRFRDDSELSHVNHGHGAPVKVSRLFLDAVDVALRAAVVTDGSVDPTVGSAMQVLGYDRDFASIDPDGPPLRVRVRPAAGWKCIRVNRAARTVRVPSGVELDLGATAKALAADRAARRIAEVTGSGVIVNLGGDCSIAGPPPPQGWIVRLADRHDDDHTLPAPTVVLHQGGIATSGTAARRWARGGRPVHHVVDPKTGRSAPEIWRTVSVAAASCVDANIASTAAIVLGARAPEWLSRQGLPSRLVRTEGAVCLVGDWPAEPAEPAA